MMETRLDVVAPTHPLLLQRRNTDPNELDFDEISDPEYGRSSSASSISSSENLSESASFPLPLVTFQFRSNPENPSALSLLIRRQNADGSIDMLYQRVLQEGEKTGLLEAFENFALQLEWPVPETAAVIQPLRLYLRSDPDDQADFELDVEYPVVLAAGSKVAGMLRIRGTYAATLEAITASDVWINAKNFEIKEPGFKAQGGVYQREEESTESVLLEVGFQEPHTGQKLPDRPHAFKGVVTAPTLGALQNILFTKPFKLSAVLSAPLLEHLQDLHLEMTLACSFDFSSEIHLNHLFLKVEQLPGSTAHQLRFLKNVWVQETIDIEAPQSLLEIGSLDNAELSIFKTEGGHLNLQVQGFTMPYGALVSGSSLKLDSEKDIVIGALEHQTKVCHFRAKGHASIFTRGKLNTHYLDLNLKNDLDLKAPCNWVDVGGRNFILGTARLDTPLNEHVIKTKPVSYAEAFCGGGRGYHAWNGQTTATLADSQPPILIANRIETTGKTDCYGGPIYAKTFIGIAPIYTSFTETYSNMTKVLCGHDKVYKAKWYDCPKRWSGKTFLANYGTDEVVYADQEIHIRGQLRASRVTLKDFKTCLIGSLENRLLAANNAFNPIIDPLENARINTALQETRHGSPSILRDILSSHSIEPLLPRVVVRHTGLGMEDRNHRPLYPWSEAQKLIAVSFLRTIGEFPPGFQMARLNLGALCHWLMQNSLEWMNAHQMVDASADTSQVLVQWCQVPLVEPKKPTLVFVEALFEHADGSSETSLCPKIVLPRAYEKLQLQDGTNLITDVLKILGADDSLLHITGSVHSRQSASVNSTEIFLETRPYHYQETLSYTTVSKKYGRKKTRNYTDVVNLQKIQQIACLRADGPLEIHSERLTQAGSVIGGESNTIQTKDYRVYPVYESQAIPYRVAGKTFLKSIEQTGFCVQASPVAAQLRGPTVLNAARGDLTALSLRTDYAHVDLRFSESLHLKAARRTQNLLPVVTKKKQILTISQGTAEQVVPNQLMVSNGRLSIESLGDYRSEGTIYVGKAGIRIRAANLEERAAVMNHHFSQVFTGSRHLMSVKGIEVLDYQQALDPTFMTGPEAGVEIEVFAGDLFMHIPQLQTLDFQVRASGQKQIVALALAGPQEPSAEEKRAQKKKKKKELTKLLISIPLSCAAGGWAVGMLKGFGMGGLSLAMGRGMTMAAARGLVQGKKGKAIARDMLQSGITAGFNDYVGVSMKNASALSQAAVCGLGEGLIDTAFNGGNLLSNTLISVGSTVAAEMVVPTLEETTTTGKRIVQRDSLGRGTLRAVVKTNTRLVLSNDHISVETLLTNTLIAAIEASVGQLAAKQGEQLALASLHPARTFEPVVEVATPVVSSSAMRDQADVLLQLEVATPGQKVRVLNRKTLYRQEKQGLFAQHAPKSASVPQAILDFFISPAHASALERPFYMDMDVGSWMVESKDPRSQSRVWKLLGANREFYMPTAVVFLQRRSHEDSILKLEPAAAQVQKSTQTQGAMAWRAFSGDKSSKVLLWQAQNRRDMPRLAQASDALNNAYEELKIGRRTLGALQVAGGAGQIAAAVAASAGALFLATMGADNVIAGLETVRRGEFQSTLLYQGINTLGQHTDLYGPETAAWIEVGLNIAGPPLSAPVCRTMNIAWDRWSNYGVSEPFAEVVLVSGALQKAHTTTTGAAFIKNTASVGHLKGLGRSGPAAELGKPFLPGFRNYRLGGTVASPTIDALSAEASVSSVEFGRALKPLQPLQPARTLVYEGHFTNILTPEYVDPNVVHRTHQVSGKTATARIEKIMVEMNHGKWPGPPLQIILHDNKYYLLDGHHRLFAAKKLKMAVPIEAIDSSIVCKFHWNTIEELVSASQIIGPDRLTFRYKGK